MKSIIANDAAVDGWLLTPRSDIARNSWAVASSGYVRSGNYVFYAYWVAPVLYLSSELRVESGDGSSSNPYKLSA